MVDFNLDAGNPLISDDVDLILQQIDILFSATPTEVLGDVNYGTTYDNYLYQLKISNSALESVVRNDLSSIDLRGFVPSVEVLLLQGTEQDIAIIDITLTRNREVYKKTYKIV